MTFSADQFMFDRFLFRGTQDDISHLYNEAYNDCFSNPECVDEGIYELEMRAENPEMWIAKYPLTKSTGFVLDWSDKRVIVVFSESGSPQITKRSRVHHFDGRKDAGDRWYYDCPITTNEAKFEEYYANVDQYDRFTYKFPFADDWFRGTYADRILSKEEFDFVIKDGVLVEYRGNDAVVVIPASVADIESTAFVKCHSNEINEIILPDSIKQIRENTFSDLRLVEKIVLPQNLAGIGKKAFSNCLKLKSLYIPDTVTEIGEGAFEMCIALRDIHLPSGLCEISDQLFFFCSELRQVEIPAGVKRLGSSAFSSCEKLNHMSIPDGVEEVGGFCFSGCTALTELNLPNSIISLGRYSMDDTPWYQERKRAGMLMIGTILLRYNTQERDVTIPNHIRTVAEYAFSENKSLVRLNFQDGMNAIKICAFKDCENLREVICPESLTSIGQNAFMNCSQLRYLCAPGVVTDNGSFGGAKFAHSELVVVMPRLNISAQKNAIMKQALCRGFLLHPELDSGDAKADNIAFAIKQKKKMLPWAFEHDYVQVVQFYLQNAAPAKNKIEAEFVIPAREAGAEECLSFIDAFCK